MSPAERKREEALLTGDRNPTGVLLTAVGGPRSLDEVGPFLLDIRGGRPTPKKLVEEFRERYRQIGGKSPLLEISQTQATALERRLNGHHGAYRCRVGMRNWHPYIRDALPDLVSDGLSRLIVLPLTPYYSARSVGTYFAAVKDALHMLKDPPDVAYVESWNTEPALVRMFASKIRAGLDRLAQQGYGDPTVVFTAHSLPKKLMDEGDPYERELSETMALVLDRLGPLRVRMAWQSAGRTEEAWLQPGLEQVLEELAKMGERAVLVVPFGFVSDHLEILYDVDIEARAFAAERGVHLERSDSPNTDPEFIEAMTAAVCPFAGPWSDIATGTPNSLFFRKGTEL
jgi:protoporphyrin/coproporphyrin ferrochelatase